MRQLSGSCNIATVQWRHDGQRWPSRFIEDNAGFTISVCNFTTIIRRSASVQGIKLASAFRWVLNSPILSIIRSALISQVCLLACIIASSHTHLIAPTASNEVHTLHRFVARHAPYRPGCPSMHSPHPCMQIAKSFDSERCMLRLRAPLSRIRWVFYVRIDSVFNLSVFRDRWTESVFDPKLAMRVGSKSRWLIFHSNRSFVVFPSILVGAWAPVISVFFG